MDSVSPADLVVVVDTGSTDHSAEKLRARGTMVFEEKIEPWRFDTARNIAMEHIPMDMDICVSNDLDEVFEDGWREKIETLWRPECTRARYWFTWSYHPDGTADKQFLMEKIHRRRGFRWIHPVHEVLEYSGGEPDFSLFMDTLVLHHHPDLSKPRSQYLPLLELSAQENPLDDRTMFWLGREYMYNNRYEECIDTLKKHLTLPSAAWDEERCASMRYLAKAYQAKGPSDEARKWLYRAIGECPHIREPYLDMAILGYLQDDWPLVFAMVETGLSIQSQTKSYLCEPEAWHTAFFDLGAICCFRLDLLEKARSYALHACEFSPDDAWKPFARAVPSITSSLLPIREP